MKEIDKEKAKFLDAILGLIYQYMTDKGGGVMYDHYGLSAGAAAASVLKEYGLAYDNGYAIVLNQEKIQEMHNDFAYEEGE